MAGATARRAIDGAGGPGLTVAHQHCPTNTLTKTTKKVVASKRRKGKRLRNMEGTEQAQKYGFFEKTAPPYYCRGKPRVAKRNYTKLESKPKNWLIGAASLHRPYLSR